MFNIKWGGIAAGAAFALALALSLLLGQTSLLIALLRAVVFAALFFGLGIAAWTLINTFIPELLSSAGGAAAGDIATNLFSTENAGSRVNITVDDTQHAAQAALPEQERSEVGDFNELFTPKEDSQYIDQIPTTSYTDEGEAEGFASENLGSGNLSSSEEFAAETEEFASMFNDAGLNDGDEEAAGEFSMDFSAFVPGGLGDGGDGETDGSDADMDSFSFFPEGAGSGTFDEPAPERQVSRNKPMKLEGDFDAREIAAGLRTVLQKDKK